MAKQRGRVDGLVREAVADIIESEVADPRLAFVSITDVSVTPDHRHAKVLYSTLDPAVLARDPRRTGGDRLPTAGEVADGLDAAASRVQGLLARRLRLRNTPQLAFAPDPVVAQAARIDELLRQLDRDEDHDQGEAGT